MRAFSLKMSGVVCFGQKFQRKVIQENKYWLLIHCIGRWYQPLNTNSLFLWWIYVVSNNFVINDYIMSTRTQINYSALLITDMPVIFVKLVILD